jgi:hypothetical protein
MLNFINKSFGAWSRLGISNALKPARKGGKTICSGLKCLGWVAGCTVAKLRAATSPSSPLRWRNAAHEAPLELAWRAPSGVCLVQNT